MSMSNTDRNLTTLIGKIVTVRAHVRMTADRCGITWCITGMLSRRGGTGLTVCSDGMSLDFRPEHVASLDLDSERGPTLYLLST